MHKAVAVIESITCTPATGILTNDSKTKRRQLCQEEMEQDRKGREQ
jgi:hypothetical protein